MKSIDFYGDAKKVFEKDKEKETYNQALEDFADSLTCQNCFTLMQKDAIKIYAKQLKR